MSYKLTNGTTIQRIADGACVPPDPANLDFVAYEKWLALGNEPIAADPEVKVVDKTVNEKLASIGLTVEELKMELSKEGS